MSASTSELSDRTQRFHRNANAKDVLAWILEYACKYGLNEVVRDISTGNPKKLLQYGIIEGRLVAYLLWNCVSENVVEGYDLCIQLLRHTYTQAPLVHFPDYAQILHGLKVKFMLHILADRFELCLASSKLKELFPKEGEKLPPALEHDATSKEELNHLNRRSSQFRHLALDLILDREKREAYLQDGMEEEFGAEFSLTLNDLMAKFVHTVEDYLPVPVIEEISSSEQYLSAPDGCSPAVSRLLAVLKVSNGNPGAADLTKMAHELDPVSTTRTRKPNSLPGRNKVKLLKPHSSFKSPKTKEKTVESHGNSAVRPQATYKGRSSAVQESTSTERSGSQTGVDYIITLSDSNDEELEEVSNELHSERSPRGKKTTRLPGQTDMKRFTKEKTLSCTKSRVCTETKLLETNNSAACTDVGELDEVRGNSRSPMSWNMWRNTLTKDLIGSNSRGRKEMTEHESSSVDKKEMQVNIEDTDDETQFSKESSGEKNQGNYLVHNDKIGAKKRTIRKEDDPKSDEDHTCPVVITLDSSIDSDMSTTSPLLLASLEKDSFWKTKRQREDEQVSTEHSRKRRKLEFRENSHEKSATHIQVQEADIQKTSNVDKIELKEKSRKSQDRKEEVDQSSCSGEGETDDNANKFEDEDTDAGGGSTSQVSISLSAERHSIEVLQETPKDSTDPCSDVGSQGETQPFSPVLQKSTQHKDDSTTFAEHTDASTTSGPKGGVSIHTGGAKAVTEEARTSQDADGLRLANVSLREGTTTSSSTMSMNRQDFPTTTMETTPHANAGEHIDASPHDGHAKEGSPAQWDRMVHCAIQNAPTGVAALADICQYISENFPHHSNVETVAQSVCRVLSTHRCFQVVSSPREIKWTLSAACSHKLLLPGPSLVAMGRESNPEDSDVTSSTPDGLDSASKVVTSNPSRDDSQTVNSVMEEEEEEKNPSSNSESTCGTGEADTAAHKSRAESCSDNTVSSSQDEPSAEHVVSVNSGSTTTRSGSSSHTLSMILEEAEKEGEESDAMLTSTPSSEDCPASDHGNPQAFQVQSSSGNQAGETDEQTQDKSRKTRKDSENSGTERGSHSQSSDESIIPPSPQEGQRSELVTFARTRRAPAVPHTYGKDVDPLLEEEDAIVSDSDGESDSTVLCYEENDEDSDTESYVIPNSHEQDDSFNSVSGPKAPVLRTSTRSALWTKDNTLVPSLSQHLSSCPVKPCVVLLHRLRVRS
ncbi:uncharacterized protein [Branchiostoma lanceolatum]|uniref:uncharacterized protein n=1 Tax=Branchiostoma lanceolatum TaxID=7740 RepID=UPI0034517AE5